MSENVTDDNPDTTAAAAPSEPQDADTSEGPATDRVQQLENEGDIAADYLEELLDIADLDGDLDMDVEGDRAAVSIVGAELQQLVGRDGEVLEALQELTRLAVYRETGERSRLMLDVSGYRAEKRDVGREATTGAADDSAPAVAELLLDRGLGSALLAGMALACAAGAPLAIGLERLLPPAVNRPASDEAPAPA